MKSRTRRDGIWNWSARPATARSRPLLLDEAREIDVEKGTVLLGANLELFIAAKRAKFASRSFKSLKMTPYLFSGC